MASWSVLLCSTGQFLKHGKKVIFHNSMKSTNNGVIQVRLSHDRVMPFKPSTWQWEKTKDYLHMYTLIGAIPCVLIMFLSHVFVGPAELTEIPEGYVPKHWEYHRDPITRFFARYVQTSPQMEYEKYLHFVDERDTKKRIRKLHSQVLASMQVHKDTAAFYYVPYISGRYARRVHREMDDHYEYGRGT